MGVSFLAGRAIGIVQFRSFNAFALCYKRTWLAAGSDTLSHLFHHSS